MKNTDQTPLHQEIPHFLSIVICTYNRAEYLRNAILSVLQQEMPANQYELLIIDNNSTDNTYSVVQEIARNSTQVRYFFEPNQGVSNARNHGFQKARGAYIGYLDDDAIAAPGWLRTAYNIIENIQPDAFGGPYFAWYITPKPRWFKDEYCSYVPDNIARPLADDEFIAGGNFFVKRSLLFSLGGFDTDFGMTDKKIAYAEETDLLVRLRENDPKALVYYDPALFIQHVVRPEKMHTLFHLKKCYSAGVDTQRVFHKGAPAGSGASATVKFTPKLASYFREIKILLILILRVVKFFTWGFITYDKKRYPWVQNYLFEKLGSICLDFGMHIEAFRQVGNQEVSAQSTIK